MIKPSVDSISPDDTVMVVHYWRVNRYGDCNFV